MNEHQRKDLERNLYGRSMFQIKHWIYDWRLEDLHASKRLGKMHQMLNMRNVLSRGRDQVAAGKGRHLV